MVNKIKKWFRRRDLEFDILNSKLDLLVSYLKPKSDIALMRHSLGVLDLSDIEDKEMNESERKKYCAAISAVFPRLEKDIKKFLYAQLLYSSNQSEIWDQVLFGRGSFYGANVLLENWKKANDEHREKSKPKEKFDKHKIVPEINE